MAAIVEVNQGAPMKLTKAQIKQALNAYKRGIKAYTSKSPKQQHEAVKAAWRDSYV